MIQSRIQKYCNVHRQKMRLRHPKVRFHLLLFRSRVGKTFVSDNVSVSLVKFFGEKKPRIVTYTTLLDYGGRTEITVIKILKKGAKYKEIRLSPSAIGLDPSLVDMTLPIHHAATNGIYLNHNHPYLIVNNYSYLPLRLDGQGVQVYTITHAGEKPVCDIPLLKRRETKK